MSDYSKGGFIPAADSLPTVTVRRVEGRTEYWEPELDRWVPVLTYAEVVERSREALETLRADALAIAAEFELADDYERNPHG